MKTYFGLEAVCPPIARSSVAIGRFDGMHLGHQSLIRTMVEDARAHGREAVVFTFDRHPAELLAPDKVPGYLQTLEQRAAVIEGLGVDTLVVAVFNERFRSLSPEAFLHFVVSGQVGAEAVFVGEDFRFGRSAEGAIDLLRSAEERYGYRTHVHPAVLVDGEKAASTRVRELLRDGEVEKAARMLGRPYALSGTVERGQQLGRTLGYPTANLRLTVAQVAPAHGIYAVWTQAAGARRMGACSIGVRPTVGGTSRTIETYLLDFSGDLYDQPMEVEFVARLRDEEKFDGLEALVAQMDRDVAGARRILSAA
jgi:riboflavin kinase/FMN adenylyltransferase